MMSERASRDKAKREFLKVTAGLSFMAGLGAEAPYSQYTGRPVEFVREVFGLELWKKQIEMLESVRDHETTVVAGCYACGKTFAAAPLVAYYLLTEKNSRVVTTAASGRQVKTVLWSEIDKLIARARVRGKRMPGAFYAKSCRWEVGPTWDAIGFSTTPDESEEAGASRFQGLHSEVGRVFIILDEAQAVSRPIAQAARSMLTSTKCRLLWLGNPYDRDTAFYDAFSSPTNNAITITAFDVFKSFRVKDNPPEGLITREWVEAVRRDYGEQSAYYQARVLAQFPEIGGVDRVIPAGDVRAAVIRWRGTEYNIGQAKPSVVPTGVPAGIIGLDVAREGDDMNVWAYLRHGHLKIIETSRGQNLMDTVGRTVNLCIRLREEANPITVIVDETGVGGGVVDRLREMDEMRDLGGPTFIRAVQFGAKATNDRLFPNKRHEIWKNMRDAIRSGAIDIPDDPALERELCEMQWHGFDSRGRRLMEKKEELKIRLGRSPDKADAVALAVEGLSAAPRVVMPTQDADMLPGVG